MRKKKVYVNEIDKKINNNQTSCEVIENSDNKEDINNNLSVEDKIDKLFNLNGYIFNKNVEIYTDDKIYYTKIAGKVGNNIITLDNDIINISSIKDIKY